MTKRTPRRIATALNKLPPRPDASIVLGEEERYGELEVFIDLLAYGHVLGPREEAEAEAGTVGRWEHAWRSAPLVIHDSGLVGAIGAMAPDLVDVSESVSTAAIGNVLDEHPGPVGCLRIESPSGCPSPDVVGKWMDHLRATKGEDGLHELIVVNTNRPKNDGSFPLRRLPGGLRSLSLCFFDLRPLDADHLFGLAELRLTACDFCGQELSAVISELYGLRTVVLGDCRLTSGCGSGRFSIVSTNLQRLEMWMCTASGGVSLQYTPRLQSLYTGVRPEDRNARIPIDMRTAGALRELHGLMLFCHDLSYVTHFNGKVKGRQAAPLPHLCTLRVYAQMSTPQQMLDLLDLLLHIPQLRHLTLMRVDNAHQDEEFKAGQEAFAAPCIINTLRELVLDNFRGGAAEFTFAIHVLGMAAQLASVHLKPHPKLPHTQAANACALLVDCPHASADCKIHLRK